MGDNSITQNNKACHFSFPPSVAPALSTGAPKRRSISSTAQTYPRPAPAILPLIPENWDYNESVYKVRPLIIKWKSLTLEIATELYIARQKLSSPYHRDGTLVPSWAEYCQEIGLTKQVANRWLAMIFGPQRIKQIPMPRLKSQVIYADPPWEYNNTGFDQSAAQHYPTLSLKEICHYKDPTGISIKDLAQERSVLFLWVTYPMAKEGIEVCEAWGFEYKAQMVWIKNTVPGIGWWVKPRHELLYIGAKGQELHPSIKFDSVFEAPTTDHSRKPERVYEMIEAMYTGPYIELFARNTRQGWESWGNEIKR